MSDIVERRTTQDRRVTPPRRHEVHPEMEGWTPAEVDAAARTLPLVCLGARLERDDVFLEHVDAVRTGAASADDVARGYVRRRGRGRSVMLRVIEQAAAEPDRLRTRLRLSNLHPVAIWVDRPATPDDRQRWRAASYVSAASWLADRGAGRCAADGCTLDVGDRVWCGPHRPALPGPERDLIDRAIKQLLARCADVLDVA